MRICSTARTAVDVLPAGSTGNQPGAMTLGDLAFFGNGAAFTKLGDFDGILIPAGFNIDSEGFQGHLRWLDSLRP